MDTLLRRSINIIYVVSFFDLLAVGLIFPLLYPHIRSLGATHFVIGIFGAAYSGLQVLSGPIIGSWSDIRGRQLVAIVTLFISSGCYLLIGLTFSLSVIFILRILLGFVKHTQTLCKAIIADLLPKEKHSEVYGRSAAIGSLGFVVGPIIGGHLSELSNGFSYVCNLTAVLFIFNIGLILCIPELKKPDNIGVAYRTPLTLNAVGSELYKAVQELSKIDWKIYWDAFVLRFLFGFSISIYFSNQALYIEEKFNLSQKNIGYTISFLSIISSLTSLMLGFISKKFYKNDTNCSQRLFHAFIIMCISFIGLYFAPNLIVYVILLVPFGISSSILRVNTMEVILSRSKDTDRGSLAGSSNSVMSVARFVSPIMSGILGDLFGQNVVMLSAFAPSLLGIGLCTKLIYKENVIKSKTN